MPPWPRCSDLTRWIMVLADFFTRKFLEPQREKYREQGRQQARREISERQREWNQRRLDAQANRERFNELPPGAE